MERLHQGRRRPVAAASTLLAPLKTLVPHACGAPTCVAPLGVPRLACRRRQRGQRSSIVALELANTLQDRPEGDRRALYAVRPGKPGGDSGGYKACSRAAREWTSWEGLQPRAAQLASTHSSFLRGTGKTNKLKGAEQAGAARGAHREAPAVGLWVGWVAQLAAGAAAHHHLLNQAAQVQRELITEGTAGGWRGGVVMVMEWVPDCACVRGGDRQQGSRAEGGGKVGATGAVSSQR